MMASTQVDRVSKPSVNGSLAIKAPCRCATTADINSQLSQGALNAGGGGLITIDGVALAAGDRVLVKNQTDQTTNGIWVAATTAWLRDVDANSNTSWLKGAIVLATDGTTQAGLWFELTTSNPVTIGTSLIAFSVTSNPTVSSAMAPVVGAATLALGRAALAAPGLGDNNTFTGTEAFNGAATFGAAVTHSSTTALNGTTTASAGVVMSGAAINEARATIASAATTNIGGAAANYLQITGATTITAFDTIQAGTQRVLEFAGTLTLTNNASIILPTGANIVTAAGDTALFVSEGGGVWRCIDYCRANGVPLNHAPLAASLGADVVLNNIGTYFDGPSVAQGTAGTWFVSGTVTMTDTASAAQFNAKLWDGTTVIASARTESVSASAPISISLSGFITSPAANLRISVNDVTATTGAIKFNVSGNSKDSTITAMRIA